MNEIKKIKIADLLLNNFEEKKNKIAFVTRKEEITYLDFWKGVQKSFEIIKSKGIKEKEKIFIFMENSIEFAEAFMAINLCNAVIIPIYVKLGNAKLQSIIDFYCPDHIITNNNNLNKIYNDEIKIPTVKNIFIYNAWDDIYTITITKSVLNNEQVNYDIALILSSSGTTSDPKGIMLTDSNIVSNVQSIAEYLKIKEDDKILMIKCINHSSSITGELLVGLFVGCEIHIYTGIIHSQVIIDYLKNNSINVFFAVPSILINIINKFGEKNIRNNSLRIIHFSGSIAQEKDIRKIIESFPNCEIINAYGLTEASPRVTYAKKDKLLKKIGTVGSSIRDVKINIMNNGRILKPYEQGEIVVSGSNIMKGYYKNQSLTEKTLIDGYLHTRDIGYIDNDGDLFVLGRKDNLIIKNGRNIYPEEIEMVISKIEEIKEVLVTESNEIIIAYLVCNDNSNDVKKIQNFCKQQLEDYKVPTKYIYVTELKKNHNNKIIRSINYL